MRKIEKIEKTSLCNFILTPMQMPKLTFFYKNPGNVPNHLEFASNTNLDYNYHRSNNKYQIYTTSDNNYYNITWNYH